MRCRAPEEEIAFLMSTFREVPVDRFWVNVVDFISEDQCKWGHFSPEENCQYLQRLFAEAGRSGVKLGINIATQEWIDAFENRTACPEVATSPLWWSPED